MKGSLGKTKEEERQEVISRKRNAKEEEEEDDDLREQGVDYQGVDHLSSQAGYMSYRREGWPHNT